MSVKKLVIMVITLILISSVAAAGYMFMPEDHELSDAFCEELDDERSYAKNNLDYYKVLIPGKDGWVFRTENDFRADYSVNEKTKKYLVGLKQALESRGTDLVIIFPPVRGHMHADQLMRKYRKKYDLPDTDALWANYENAVADLQRSGIPVVGIKRDEATPDYFYKRSHHWSASGARVTAQKAAELIKILPGYKSIPKASYQTMRQEAQPYDSAFEKAFRKVCGTRLPDEIAAKYTTVASGTEPATDETALFGDDYGPGIVLLGTSNSVDETSSANFEGFLKEYLSADVLNNAFIGAGIDTSIMSYLNSDHFQSGQAKIVIWEVPGYYDFNIMDDKLFNQIIPAAYGSCPRSAVANARIGNLTRGDNPVFDLGAATLISGQSGHYGQSAGPGAMKNHAGVLYMHLSFTKPVKQKFAIEFEYKGGGTKRQEFTRSNRYPHDGEFYTLFPVSQSNANLDKVRMVLPQGMENTQVEVQVCPLPPDSVLANPAQQET